MPRISGSAKIYQERKNLIPTLRGPGPIISLQANAVNTIPLKAPLASPALLHEKNNPPDGGATQVWPHGEESIT